ncbi:hypothetical protein ODJ79_06470 [Actinoplanes sp. KI2]|jgi:hypothetical protein|uniref:hypothetical protein n=1 Tax=Actinoplanes sp. KI2 TaxID=2983315 RepID=UPI0021D57C8C|nr:hypothetical protein [Actinoplanes sp. KI2]MCU7723349.1 hypothetical protein [Actinoplanes sp. KI2]
MSDTEQQEQDEQPEEFLNRAARRAAKHKKHAHGLATTGQAADQGHGRGAAPARKSFTSRRSGG